MQLQCEYRRLINFENSEPAIPSAPSRYTGNEMTQDQSPAPAPVARKRRTETLMHGVVLTDDYAWLRDKQDPEVTAYLEAENAHAEAWMAPLAALREDLYKEMLSHIKQTDVSVPFRDGDWWYCTRTEEGQQYAVTCRKAATDRITPSDCHPERGRGGDRVEGPAFSFLDDTPEQVILDGNQLAQGLAFFAIGATDITDDGRWLAYTTDTTGFRQYTLHIKDLGTGETLPGEVQRVGSVVWAADNCTLFYTVEDEEQKRQYQLWRHQRGTPHTGDVLVYQDDDERFNLGAGRTRDGKFIVLESASHITTESQCFPPPTPKPHSPSSLLARTITSTPSTTAMACGSSAPTTAAATSAWSQPPYPRRTANTGPSSFPIATP